jgi:hypothetical protein
VLVLLAGLVSAGCKPAQTASGPGGPDAQTSQQAMPPRPSAADIQARIQKVQQDPQMSAEAKAMLVGEMQHALGSPRSPGSSQP